MYLLISRLLYLLSDRLFRLVGIQLILRLNLTLNEIMRILKLFISASLKLSKKSLMLKLQPIYGVWLHQLKSWRLFHFFISQLTYIKRGSEYWVRVVLNMFITSSGVSFLISHLLIINAYDCYFSFRSHARCTGHHSYTPQVLRLVKMQV